MTRHAAISHRLTALTLWLASLAWLAWGPHSPGVHRTLVAAASAFTVIAVLERHVVDAAVTARLAADAGYQQARADHSAEH